MLPGTQPPLVPLPVHQSTRQTKPMPALIAVKETLQREQAACESGEAWAAGEGQMTALLSGSPFAYLSSPTNNAAHADTAVPKTCRGNAATQFVATRYDQGAGHDAGERGI